MENQEDLFGGTEDEASPPAALPAARQERVIRFGKYKNQPYEILLTDAGYSLWLLSSMFAKLQEQHPGLLAFLVGRFGQPDSTPDHNRLQNRFLDKEFALRFALAVSQRIWRVENMLASIDPAASWQRYAQGKLKTESERAERMRRYEKGDPLAKCRDDLIEQARRLAFVIYTGRQIGSVWHDAMNVSRLEFENDGADVSYMVECGAALVVEAAVGRDAFSGLDEARGPQTSISSFGERDGFRIEVKPIVGDDYPAILRAMKAVKDTHLLVGEYCGAGATWDEVARVFGLSGIRAVRLEDVERTHLPEAFGRAEIRALSVDKAQDIVKAAYADLTK